MTHPLFVSRQSLELRGDCSRVVVRSFRPSVEPRAFNLLDRSRADHVIGRILSLGADETHALLAQVLANFDGRHRNLLRLFGERADAMLESYAPDVDLTPVHRQLLGAFFLNEYSFEAAALFNPSIVAHPDQSGMAGDALRVVLSLRAVGEGHVSSLTFRTATVHGDGSVTVDPANRLAALPKLRGRVGDMLDLVFDAETELSERIVFPVTDAQSNGLEDARFVAFDEDGQTVYHATYTAYSGRAIRSELLSTTDFLSFRLIPLKGTAASNKGMALFPRKVNGHYAMIGRQDNENLHLLYSDDLLTWNEGVKILTPRFPWEFVQLGNCGSPIETDKGWLLLTHGVGPMRHYSIGAVLLDLADPSIVIARSHEPLLQPEQSEREGYVPNVVYTCGAIRHGNRIVIPYAVSDSYCAFASCDLDALLATLQP